jgi:hypothetical protein
LFTVKSPPIVEGPSSVISPVAPEPMRMLPATDEQLVYAAASACELMVAVAVWEQIDCAGNPIELASSYPN